MPATPAENPSHHAGRWTAAIALVALAVLVGAAMCWRTTATAAYRASFGNAPVSVRSASAAHASLLEPWNATYAKRALVLDRWNRGANALAAGDYASAIALLDVAYRNDIGDMELLAVYHQAQDLQAVESNRKAHLQHGHEGPGGTLTPAQVER